MPRPAYDMPAREDLERMVAFMPITEVARHFAVSKSTARAWCVRHGVETKPRGYWIQKLGSQGTAVEWWRMALIERLGYDPV